MNTKKYIYLFAVLALLGGFILAIPALAENGQSTIKTPSITGTVSAISGNTITIVSKKESDKITTGTTLTVDASGAKITKDGATFALASISVGDIIAIKGAVTGSSVVAVSISIQGTNRGENEKDSGKMNPAVVGKVSVISGNIITVVSNKGQNTTSGTTFTVDATSAKILRGETTITVSNIAVGDNIVVQGTVTGTNVVATTIRDGKIGNGNNDKIDNNQALLQIHGNGQPIVSGTISAISGSTITITNSSNVTYTINATSAKIVQGKNISTIAGLKVGDLIIVQGAVNGTAITASTIISQTPVVGAKNEGEKKGKAGFFGSIGQWFRRLFGF